MSGGSIEIRDMVARRGSFLLRVDELYIEPHEIFAIVGGDRHRQDRAARGDRRGVSPGGRQHPA